MKKQTIEIQKEWVEEAVRLAVGVYNGIHQILRDMDNHVDIEEKLYHFFADVGYFVGYIKSLKSFLEEDEKEK